MKFLMAITESGSYIDCTLKKINFHKKYALKRYTISKYMSKKNCSLLKIGAGELSVIF